MDKWEYMSAWLGWDSDAQEWKVVTSSGSFLRGKSSGEALNPEGEQGWELVSIVSQGYTMQHVAGGQFGMTAIEYVDQWGVQGFRAYFKRRKP